MKFFCFTRRRTKTARELNTIEKVDWVEITWVDVGIGAWYSTQAKTITKHPKLRDVFSAFSLFLSSSITSRLPKSSARHSQKRKRKKKKRFTAKPKRNTKTCEILSVIPSSFPLVRESQFCTYKTATFLPLYDCIFFVFDAGLVSSHCTLQLWRITTWKSPKTFLCRRPRRASPPFKRRCGKLNFNEQCRHASLSASTPGEWVVFTVSSPIKKRSAKRPVEL